MKKGCLAVLLLFLLSVPAEADMLGVEAVDFSLNDVNGKAASLSSYSDKIVALVHLNTYCYSCREEVPLLNEIQKKFPSLKVIGIATANDAEETLQFKKQFGVEFLLLPDPGKEVYQKYFVHTVPLVDIIDRSGTIRYRGKLPSQKKLASLLTEISQDRETVGTGLWSRPPDFTLKTVAGSTFRLQDGIGSKTIVLTFFSVNDETTRQLIEIMKTLYSRYKRDDLGMVRVAVRDNPGEIEKFIKKHHVNFPIILDPKGEVAGLYGITDLPRTFVINKKGKIRFASDQISLTNFEAVLTKFKSYIREELPEDQIRDYLKKLEPDVSSFNRVALSADEYVYIGFTADNRKVVARQVFKDVLCDVCTNVHYVYSFDMLGAIRNLELIESIDLYGVQIDAEDYLSRLVEKSAKKLPLRLKKDIDAISGATQTCKLILEGLNETPQIIEAIKTYQSLLARP